MHFVRFFSECVEIMQPRLIVTLGSGPAAWIGADYSRRSEVRNITFGAHETRVIAIVHTGAWTWKGLGFTNEQFPGEGRRIKAALNA